MKRKKALPSTPPVDPPISKRRTQRTTPSDTTPLGVGDWSTDKDMLCGLKQEHCYIEIDEPRAWAVAVFYIKGLSKCMRIVESSAALGNMAWCVPSPHFIWLIVMTKKGQFVLCALSTVVSG